MGLVIQDDILESAHISEAELKQEIAVQLFQGQHLSLAQSSRFAGVTRLRFQNLLAWRAIPIHYDTSELDQDLKTLREMDRG
jgi:predicted HTH domain antitoxin